jgi:hypothetical protein
MIVVVSGLPRSGTSMMMNMLKAGGIPLLTDISRKADEENPKGYYEFERVKQLEEDASWLKKAEGKAVKVISYLLEHLPDYDNYKIVFMQRKIEEVLASQKKMIERRGEIDNNKVSDEAMAKLFEKHLKEVDEMLKSRTNMNTIYVSYNKILEKPEPHLERINMFLGGELDTKKMAQVVDPKLHRQRK